MTAMKRVAINGFGRIGRNFLRAYLERRPDYEIVAINDLGDVQTMAHLLEFDSLLGRLSEEVNADTETITVRGHELQAFSIPEPKDLPWRELGIDVVVESTGRFTQARSGAGTPGRRRRQRGSLGGGQRRRRDGRARRQRRRLRP